MANSARKISNVEKCILEKNSAKLVYSPTEKISTIIVDNFPALGKLAALRFIEWAQQNAGWTIALPTGKTPEHFIKWVEFLLQNWRSEKAEAILAEHGIDPAKKPDMQSFHFIQIDEFYPINSWQRNSFYHYVKHYYIDSFGIDPDKALLIDPNEIGLAKNQMLDQVWPQQKVDLSLRTRYPKNVMEREQKRVLDEVDQFCTEYERRIRALGGIGFFLGGIGPDGHIGFNVKGADHFSTTRLTETNYETQAAAATDLGGIEISRNRLVITIGLQTIVYSPDTTAIIIAAGEAKAQIVKKAIESEISNDVPASILQQLPNATFYITHGAAKHLLERRLDALKKKDALDERERLRIATDLALGNHKKLTDLKQVDFERDRLGQVFKNNLKNSLTAFLNNSEIEYQQRILSALSVPHNQVFLHTAPHHDDIMLGYLPYLVRLMRDQSNEHHFNYLTSGFTAVTNAYMLKQVENADKFLQSAYFQELVEENYFSPKNAAYRNRDVFQYLDGFAASSNYAKREGEARRFLRNLAEIYNDKSNSELGARLRLLKTYFSEQYPGKKDQPDIQQLKGMVREWEADVLWGYFGFNTQSVIHSRLGFYQGDIFTEEPEIRRDVLPVLATIKNVKPTIMTVALDPEGSGPDTHYKVLQAVSTALKLYQQETGIDTIKVWGYRNVWYRYHPCEANLFVPVTMNGMAILQDAFLNSFSSQAEASFPSYEYDGPFSGLAKKIQVEQYQYMKTVLGRDFFYQNPDSRIRSTRGLVFLKVMDMQEFFEISRELRKTTEAI